MFRAGNKVTAMAATPSAATIRWAAKAPKKENLPGRSWSRAVQARPAAKTVLRRVDLAQVRKVGSKGSLAALPEAVAGKSATRRWDPSRGSARPLCPQAPMDPPARTN
jgi:hypothetical protein